MSFRGAFSLSVAGLMAVGCLTGCAGQAGNNPAASEPVITPVPTISITRTKMVVIAEKGLAPVLENIRKEFEEKNLEMGIEFDFKRSAADVKSAAAKGPHAAVIYTGTASGPKADDEEGGVRAAEQIIAVRTHVLVVPKGNPQAIKSLQDVSKVAVASAKDNELGEGGIQLLKKNGIADSSVSLISGTGADVVKAVQSGSAPAAILPKDVARGYQGSVDVVDIPQSQNVTEQLLIAVSERNENPDNATTFVNYTASSKRRSVFLAAGFDEYMG